ncbi:16S rRNA (guanine1207-N2)-methyltransferase [Isoptericola sp. CG 20/1183]|uniref:16S rRNA (Guanine1207-N2)-methyltransferase n=1 Tax=Isoptericola halotolerans TaxID=300560 RepID=A0ABX5EDI9_9MICO|nr:MULTISPECIES: methyltransferase [Isoptericola]PRZ06465.1 16S rRNA (guanine1207-N2)-methyltransferase [Isoptericola halotolerans]PRZ06729.1 16S rRNA (guanine1207-N2)-methyltransferase [Isoptericola sp. CG 20/1183]
MTSPAVPPPSLTTLLDQLVPWPDDGTRPDAPVAVDATDRLLLAEAAPLVADAGPRGVVVVGDRFGALTLGALALGAATVRTHHDTIDSETATLHNASRVRDTLADARGRIATSNDLGPTLLDGARLVLLQLPKSLGELTEIAEAVARYAADDVTLLAGGRIKHMTRAMNDVLGDRFESVHATLARSKSRALVATTPRPEARSATPLYPARERLTDPELLAAATPTHDGAAPAEHVDVVAHGGAFAGAGLDHGTRFLLTTAGRWPAASRVRDAVDLGSGTGLLAVVLGRRYPDARVVGTDRSAAAVASTRATLAANGVPGTVTRSDVGVDLPDASADLVLLNPPFHDRAAVSTDAAHRMFATAGRILRPGGELWCVFNTKLRYRGSLARAVGPTDHVAQDPRFTVTRSRKP